jgi:hypothetical protein
MNNDLVTVTELKRGFNSPKKKDAVRGNPQPQKCTNGCCHDLHFHKGIIESVRRERHATVLGWKFVFNIWQLCGENYAKDWFHQALLDESDKDGHSLETLTSSHLSVDNNPALT